MAGGRAAAQFTWQAAGEFFHSHQTTMLHLSPAVHAPFMMSACFRCTSSATSRQKWRSGWRRWTTSAPLLLAFEKRLSQSTWTKSPLTAFSEGYRLLPFTMPTLLRTTSLGFFFLFFSLSDDRFLVMMKFSSFRRLC